MTRALAKPLPLLLSLSLAGYLASAPVIPSRAADAETAPATGIQPEYMDKTVSPCENFFEYANGAWLKKTEIPADRPSWGVLNIINDKNLELLRKLLEKAESTAAAEGSNEKKLGDLYFSGMNEKEIEAQGIKPLDEELQKIQAIDSLEALRKETARLHQFGVEIFFVVSSGQDFKDSTRVIAQTEQGGLGLPDRDYYLEADEDSKKTREQYVAHMNKMFALAGADKEKASRDAETIMRIETAFARASMKKEEMRNPEAVYHKMELKEVEALTPHFSWKQYVSDIGFPDISVINVGQPDFFKAMDHELATVSLDDWKTYLRWHLLNDAAPYLSSALVNEDFDFNGRILKGSKALLPRWKRVVEATNMTIGMALGEQYVKAAFPPDAKEHALALVKRLKDQLRGDLETLDWMGPETRKQALKKLEAFGQKIGYPDKWRDYSALKIDRQSYLWNVM
ncbi:MAG TPA: M13 family metallopeptidase N-terminal domain-containing protein, partial [Chroococcales cyanobacterium]